MNLLQVDSKLRALPDPCFSTRDIAGYLGVSIVYASNILRRLALQKRVVALARGRFVYGECDPLAVPQYLTTPFLSYVSLYSALHHHGMISQIPTVVYAVTLSRTAIIKTPIAHVSLHHIKPEFFFGYELVGKFHVKMAVPEKALLDFVYLSTTRARLFHSLPELELPKNFNYKLAKSMIRKIPSTTKRTQVQKGFERLCDQASVA